jgi:hypothetical protein
MNWAEITEKIMVESECNTPAFKKWLLTKKNDGGVFFNPMIYRRAFYIQDDINNNDSDHFIVVSGKEGKGKTTIAICMACTIDPTFNISRICFKPIDFIKGIRNAPKGACFVLDEGNLFLFSRESLGADNIMMVKLFALMRQKNICVIICVPNFFTLDSYVRDHRVDTLINCTEKGQFQCYVKKAIKIISSEGYKYKNIEGIIVPAGTRFSGYFNKFFPKINDISIETYKQHKGNQFEIFLDELECMIGKQDGGSEYIAVSVAEKIVPLHRDTYVRYIKSGKFEGKKIAGRWFVHRKCLTNSSYAGGGSTNTIKVAGEKNVIDTKTNQQTN